MSATRVVKLLEDVSERNSGVGLLCDAGHPGALGEVVDAVGKQGLGAGDVAAVDDLHRHRTVRHSSLVHNKRGHVPVPGLLVAERVHAVQQRVEQPHKDVVQKLVPPVPAGHTPAAVAPSCKLRCKALLELGVCHTNNLLRELERTLPYAVYPVPELS